MNSQKGVTAISMVIVVVVIILLAGFSVFSSRDLVVEANLSKIYNEVSILSDAIKKISLNNSYQNTIFDTLKITDIALYNDKVGGELVAGNTYYYLGFHDNNVSEGIKQSLNDFLSVRGIEHNYIVRIIDEGVVRVYLVDGVKVKDTYYYNDADITTIYQNVNLK